MDNLCARIGEVKERLKRAQRDRTGKLTFLMLYDDLVDEIEGLLNQNVVRRFELCERLGLELGPVEVVLTMPTGLVVRLGQ